MVSRWTLLLVLAIAGCAAGPTRVPVAPRLQPADFPAAFYRAAAADGEPVFRVDPDHSIVKVYVYRAGSLAHLGHDHVAATRSVVGYVFAPDDVKQARADLYVSLDALELDAPALREAAGLAGQLTAEEIAQTREHMLNETLQAQRYPFVQLHVTWAEGASTQSQVRAEVTLHGLTYTYLVPVRYVRRAGALVAVSGHFSPRQSDFGIVPYSVLGGALQVQDQMQVDFSLEAERVAAPQ